MHVVFTALERVIGEEDEPDSHVPDLSPGTRGTALASVDVIGRIYQKEQRTVKGRGSKKKETKEWVDMMLVGPHENYETKDRTGVLGRVMKNPTIPAIIEVAGIVSEEEE
jgi:hypothetical protein